MTQISPEHRAAYLAAHPIFARLDRDQRRHLATSMAEHRFAAGETIFVAGDPADRMYVIVSGTVRICILSEEGREILLNVMRPNDIFGEIALLDAQTRTAGAVALTDCHFLSMNRAQFLALLGNGGSLAAEIFTVLVGRLRHMSELLHNLTLRPVEGRIPFVLGLLADRHGHKDPDGVAIDLRISQADLGAIAGATRQTVNRELKRLERLGLIAFHGRRIVIRDRPGLDRLLHVDGAPSHPL
jgi:CRP/FNR family transcriptional regulator, cyclic AMP receptor protein